MAPKWTPQATAEILASFMDPGGGSALGMDAGSMRANDILTIGSGRQSRIMENQNRMIADPTNPRYQMINSILQGDEEADIHSPTHTARRNLEAQKATDVMDRFFSQQPMRDQQNIELGDRAEELAYGTGQGNYKSQISDEGTAALDAGGQREVAVESAKAKAIAALKLGIGLGGPRGAPGLAPSDIKLPPGFTMDAYDGDDDPDDLTKTERAQALFAENDVDPGTQAIVKSILQFRMGGITGAALARSPKMQRYMELANMIDPNLNLARYDAGRKMFESITGNAGGTLGLRAGNANQFSGHLQALFKDRHELGNTNILPKWAQTIKNYPKSHSAGGGQPTKYHMTKAAATEELAKLLAPTGAATDASKKNLEGGVDENSPFVTQEAWENSMVDLMRPRLESMGKEVDSLNSPFLKRLYESRLIPATREVISGQFDASKNKVSSAPVTAPPTAAPRPAAAPTSVDRVADFMSTHKPAMRVDAGGNVIHDPIPAAAPVPVAPSPVAPAAPVSTFPPAGTRRKSGNQIYVSNGRQFVPEGTR